MIWASLTEKGLAGLRNGWWLLIAALGCIALYFAITGLLDRLESSAETRGATIQRESDLTETIKRTEQGNAAREEIRAPGPVGDRARYDQCVQSARTPANCHRLLPQRPADHD